MQTATAIATWSSGPAGRSVCDASLPRWRAALPTLAPPTLHRPTCATRSPRTCCEGIFAPPSARAARAPVTDRASSTKSLLAPAQPLRHNSSGDCRLACTTPSPSSSSPTPAQGTQRSHAPGLCDACRWGCLPIWWRWHGSPTGLHVLWVGATGAARARSIASTDGEPPL